MEGYKAFNPGWRCRDFQYKIGKTYELPEGQTLKMCECGFHFCKNPIDVFGYYPMNDNTLIAKVEALGEIQQEGTKYVTDKIKIVREFTRKELQALIIDGSYNSGNYNSGNHNTGNFNSGNYNTGNHNSGSCNTGNFNSGSCNTGNLNSGDLNSGYLNSGDFNTGNLNSGNFNTGNCNSGYFNSGSCNSGYFNSGIFNTDEPCMRAFNRETDIRYSDFTKTLDYNFNYLCQRISNKSLQNGDIDRIKALPNFDAEIFKEITGIDITERREE